MANGTLLACFLLPSFVAAGCSFVYGVGVGSSLVRLFALSLLGYSIVFSIFLGYGAVCELWLTAVLLCTCTSWEEVGHICFDDRD